MKNQGDGNNNVNGECHKCDLLQVKDEGSEYSANDYTQMEAHKNDKNPSDSSDKKKKEDLDLEDLMEVKDS